MDCNIWNKSNEQELCHEVLDFQESTVLFRYQYKEQYEQFKLIVNLIGTFLSIASYFVNMLVRIVLSARFECCQIEIYLVIIVVLFLGS